MRQWIVTKWLALKTKPWFRRSVRTFLQSFLGLMVPGVLGFMRDVTEWAQGQGQTPFPDAHSVAYLGIVAICSGFIAVVTGLWTKFEEVSGHALLRQLPPKD